MEEINLKKYLFIVFILFVFILTGCSKKKFTISFNCNGGSIVDPITQGYDTPIVKSEDQMKINKQFF